MGLINLNACEKGFYYFETKCLNYFGYVPVVSNGSAAARLIFAKALLLASIVFACVFLYKAVRGPSEKAEKNFTLAKRSALFAVHGAFNAARALAELLPFGGFLLCVPYDFYLKKRFAYSIEAGKRSPSWSFIQWKQA